MKIDSRNWEKIFANHTSEKELDPTCKRNYQTLIIMGLTRLAQWVKVFAAKSNDLGLLPGSHILEAENWLPYVVL